MAPGKKPTPTGQARNDKAQGLTPLLVVVTPNIKGYTKIQYDKAEHVKLWVVSYIHEFHVSDLARKTKQGKEVWRQYHTDFEGCLTSTIPLPDNTFPWAGLDKRLTEKSAGPGNSEFKIFFSTLPLPADPDAYCSKYAIPVASSRQPCLHVQAKTSDQILGLQRPYPDDVDTWCFPSPLAVLEIPLEDMQKAYDSICRTDRLEFWRRVLFAYHTDPRVESFRKRKYFGPKDAEDLKALLKNLRGKLWIEVKGFAVDAPPAEPVTTGGATPSKPPGPGSELLAQGVEWENMLRILGEEREFGCLQTESDAANQQQDALPRFLVSTSDKNCLLPDSIRVSDPVWMQCTHRAESLLSKRSENAASGSAERQFLSIDMELYSLSNEGDSSYSYFPQPTAKQPILSVPQLRDKAFQELEGQLTPILRQSALSEKDMEYRTAAILAKHMGDDLALKMIPHLHFYSGQNWNDGIMFTLLREISITLAAKERGEDVQQYDTESKVRKEKAKEPQPPAIVRTKMAVFFETRSDGFSEDPVPRHIYIQLCQWFDSLEPFEQTRIRGSEWVDVVGYATKAGSEKLNARLRKDRAWKTGKCLELFLKDVGASKNFEVLNVDKILPDSLPPSLILEFGGNKIIRCAPSDPGQAPSYSGPDANAFSTELFLQVIKPALQVQNATAPSQDEPLNRCAIVSFNRALERRSLGVEMVERWTSAWPIYEYGVLAHTFDKREMNAKDSGGVRKMLVYVVPGDWPRKKP